MHSTPPAIIHFAIPLFILAFAIAMVSNPEEQYLFTVIPGTFMVSSPIKEIIRPIFNPCSVKQIVNLDLDDEVLEDDSTLNTLETTQVNTEVMKIESREREERLRNISIKLRTPSGLTSLEDVPAYKRNNVEISEPTHSSESELSTYTLTNENNTTELKQNNSFLHDNVD